MALYLLATAVDGSTTLTAAIWNAEFRNIYQNMRIENLTATPTAAQAGRLAFVTLAGNNLFILDTGSAIQYVPSFSTAVSATGLGTISKVVTATGSCVWPAMNSGATISTTITVTGATTVNSNQVLVSHTAVTAASVLMYGYVSALNTVTVALYNGTGAVYNAGSGTLRATLIKYV